MPDVEPEPAYPAEAAVRKVRSNGEIRWSGELIHISSPLVGKAVAVEESEDGSFQVRFFDTALGAIDLDKCKLRRLPAPGGAELRAANVI